MAGALVGTRVLDITQGIAGPYCSMQLGDAGAEVIKVEPLEGDVARGMGPPFIGDESAVFLSLNRNKKSIVLDLKSEKGRSVLLKLAKEVDVFLDDLGPGVADEIGLGYEALSAINPKLIYASISAFGEKGPLRDLPGAEFVVQAMAEYHTSLGQIGDPPVRLGTDVANMNAGVFAFQAILAALFHRVRTGEGQQVSTSLLGGLMQMRGLMWTATSDPDGWYGFHCDSYVKPPEHGYKTKDGRVYFNLRRGSQEDYDNLLIQFGLIDYAGDPRFGEGGRNVTGTGVYAHEVKHLWEEGFKDKTTAEILEMMKRVNAEAVPIVTDYDTLFAHPQMPYFDMIEEIEHPTAGKIKVTGIPWKLADTPGEIVSPPPLLGQHTDEILSSVGYRVEDIVNLREARVAR